MLRSIFIFWLRGHYRIVRDRGNQPFAKRFFLDLMWCMAHIDDEAVDFLDLPRIWRVGWNAF